jgi:hypothetical protein
MLLMRTAKRIDQINFALNIFTSRDDIQSIARFILGG